MRFGSWLWKRLHAIADRWPCDVCRPSFSVWMQGLHDAVNTRLGKAAFRPDPHARFLSGSLDGRAHITCSGCRFARLGARVLARSFPSGRRSGPSPFTVPSIVDSVFRK